MLISNKRSNFKSELNTIARESIGPLPSCFPLLPQALTKLKVTQFISRKDSQEEEEESNAISQFDAQLRLLEWKLMQAKILASGEEKGKIDDSVINFEIREESNDKNLAAISVASCKNTNIEVKSKISIHDDEESIF